MKSALMDLSAGWRVIGNTAGGGGCARGAGTVLACGLFLAYLVFGAPCLTAGAQEGSRVTSLAEALSGSVYPLKRRVGDLHGNWRKVREGSMAEIYSQAAASRVELSGTYYTQGETFTVGTVTFLVAYRAPRSVPVSTASGDGSNPDSRPASRLSSATQLDLALLNLAAVHSLTAIEPVDLTKEIASEDDLQADRAKAAATTSLSNAKQISLALLMYCQDYDEVLPPRASAYKQAALPYIKNESVFTAPLDPKGSVSYALNRRLQGRAQAEIPEPARTILLYEGKNEQPLYRYSGKTVIAFADGHVRLCSPEYVETLDWGKNLPARRTAPGPDSGAPPTRRPPAARRPKTSR